MATFLIRHFCPLEKLIFYLERHERLFLGVFGLKKKGRKKIQIFDQNHCVFTDVTAAILVSQNNETAAMLVSKTSPAEVELFSYAHAFFCSNKFA